MNFMIALLRVDLVHGPVLQKLTLIARVDLCLLSDITFSNMHNRSHTLENKIKGLLVLSRATPGSVTSVCNCSRDRMEDLPRPMHEEIL